MNRNLENIYHGSKHGFSPASGNEVTMPPSSDTREHSPGAPFEPVALHMFREALRNGFERASRLGAQSLGDIVGALIERRREQKSLPEGKEPYRWLLKSSPEAVILADERVTIAYANPQAGRLLGVTPEELLGVSFLDYLASDEDVERVLAPHHPEWTSAEGTRLSLTVQRADGSRIGVQAFPRAYDAAKEETARSRPVAWYIREDTEIQELEESLSLRAQEDPLTGLVNRRLFMDRLERALWHANRSGKPVSLLYVDLDDLKLVNDSLGHAAGDRLLVVLAERLRSCIRQEDTAARLGGDEFAILIEDVSDTRDIYHLAERIMSSLQAPVIVGQYALDLSASIGIAFSAAGIDTPSNLLEAADAAMYEVKRGRKNGYEFYSPPAQTENARKARLETEFREATLRHQLEVHYQPMVELASRRLIAFEALFRWRHPVHGIMKPEHYMDFARRSGLIMSVGAWVLARSCEDAVQWATGDSDSPPLVSVNLSILQLRQPNMTAKIEQALESTGLPPSRLMLEIPEDLVVGEIQDLEEKLYRLRELGVKLAIDDFGAGRAWLSHVRHLPANYLKIDRQFVEDLDNAPERGSALIASCIRMSRALGMISVAEGIENTSQLASLRELQCEVGQGNLLSKPVPADEVQRLIERRPWTRL